MESRGVSQDLSRNINAPIAGVYPFGDPQLRVLTESVGVSRTHQVVFSPSVNYKRLQMFGFYGISFGKDNITSSPADPYNLRARMGTVRILRRTPARDHWFEQFTLPWNISLSPFLTASTGMPYNITTGRDTNGDGVSAERPALESRYCGRRLPYRQSYLCRRIRLLQSASGAWDTYHLAQLRARSGDHRIERAARTDLVVWFPRRDERQRRIRRLGGPGGGGRRAARVGREVLAAAARE